MSTCCPRSTDGLGPLAQNVLDVMKAAAEAAAAKAAAAAKPSAVDATLKAAGKAPPQASGGSQPAAADGSGISSGAGGDSNPLDSCVRLLAGTRWAGLDQLDAVNGKAKKLGVYRWAWWVAAACWAGGVVWFRIWVWSEHGCHFEYHTALLLNSNDC